MLTKLLSISALLFTASNAVRNCTGANTFDLTIDSLLAAVANPTGFSASSVFSFTPECADIYVTIDVQLYLNIKEIIPGPLRILTQTEVDATTIDITQNILKTPGGAPYQLTLTLVDTRRRLATAVTDPLSLRTILTLSGEAGDEYTLIIDALHTMLLNLEYDSAKSPPSTDELIDIANTAALDFYITAITVRFTDTIPWDLTGFVFALDTMVDATLDRAKNLEHVELVTFNQSNVITYVILDIIDGVNGRDFTLTVTDCDAEFAGYYGCCNGQDFTNSGLGSGQLQACVACYGTANTYYALTCAEAECEALDKDIVGCCLIEELKTPEIWYLYPHARDNTKKDCCLDGGIMTSTTKTCEEVCRSDTTLCADNASVEEGCCFWNVLGSSFKTTQCDCNCGSEIGFEDSVFGYVDYLPEFVLDQAFSTNNVQCIASCGGLDIYSEVCCNGSGIPITTTPYKCCVLNEGDATVTFTEGACPASCSFDPDPEGCCEYTDPAVLVTAKETLTRAACCEFGTTATFYVNHTCSDACYTLPNNITSVCCTDVYISQSFDESLDVCCGSGASVDINGNDCASACRAELSCVAEGCCIRNEWYSYQKDVVSETECDCICGYSPWYEIEFVAEGSTSLDGYTCSDADCIGVDDIIPGCCMYSLDVPIVYSSTTGTEYECCVHVVSGAVYLFTEEAECSSVPCLFTEERTGCCGIDGTETDQTEQYCCENDGDFDTAFLCGDVCRTPSESNKICCEISNAGGSTLLTQVVRSSDQTEAYCCNAGGILSTQTCENDCRADETQCKDPTSTVTGCCTDVDGVTTLKTECDCNCEGLGVGASVIPNTFTADTKACPDVPTTTTTTTEEGEDAPPTTTTTTDTEGDGTPTTTTTTEKGPTTTVLGCDETKDDVRTDYCDLQCTEEPYLAMVLEFNVCSVGGMGNSRNELFDIIQDCVGKTLDETVGVSVTGIHLTMNDFLFKGKQSSDENDLCTTSEDEKGYTYRFGLSLCEFGCNDLFTLYEYVLGITETVALKDIDVCVWVATSYTLRDIDGSFIVGIIGDDCERVETGNSGSGIEMIYPSLMVFVLGLTAALRM